MSKSALDDCRLESILEKRNPWWKKANGKEILGKTVHRNMNMEHANGKILAGLTGHKEKRKGNARAGSATCSISFEKRLPMAGSRESGFSPLDNDNNNIVQQFLFSPGIISW